MAFDDKKVRFDIEGRNKTTKAFKEVNSSMSKLSGVAGKLAAALGGAFAVGRIAAFGKETLAAADAIGKFADRAGVSTDELQKMRYAFDLAGVGVEAVDKGLLNFGKRLGKAHQGIGALKGGLKGGEEALLDMLMATDSQSEALDVIFKAMGAAETQRRKLAIADAAFGMAGLRMTAAFREGSDEFFRMKQEAEMLGVVLDESMIRKAEELNDQMSKVSKVIGAKLMMAFSGLFPVIMSVSDAILDMTMKLQGLSNILGKDSVAIHRMLLLAREEVKELQKQVDGLHDAFGPSELFVKWWLTGKLEDAQANVKHLERAFEGLNQVVIKLQKTQKQAVEPFDFGMDDIFDKMGDKREAALRQWYKNQIEADKAADKAIKSEEEKIQLYLDEIYFEKELARHRANGEEQTAKMMEIQQQLGIISTKKYLKEEEEIKNIIAEHERYNRQLEIQNRIVIASGSIFDRWGDGMLTALQKGEDAFESFKNTAMAALFDIGREMMKLLIFDPLKQAMAPALRQFASAVGSSIGGGGSAASYGDNYDHEFADGGPVSGKHPILVGERGPEIFMPNGAGNVIPNNQIGGGTNITLNFSTGIQSTVRAEVMGLLPVINQTVQASIAEARQRGGSFSAAMGV